MVISPMLGDRLAEAEPLIDWETFKPIVVGLYTNDGPQGGRPNIDPVVMVKLLVLQQWYALSDPELERQTLNRIDFQHFLGFPGDAPDYSTVWSFRERLAETGTDRLIWEELQRQLDEKGLKVRKGVVQDASFITSDPGHAPADKPRGVHPLRTHGLANRGLGGRGSHGQRNGDEHRRDEWHPHPRDRDRQRKARGTTNRNGTGGRSLYNGYHNGD